MRGKSDQQILAERENLKQRAKAKLGEVEFLESFFEGAEITHPLQFLGEALKLLATADYAIFGGGWGQARGCRIEHLCALEYGIKII